MKILVVEDDPGMALLVSDRLDEVPEWEVTTVASATECRAQVEESRFDVVLLDRGLPDCDGASLISELLAANPDTAIVMLTGADSAASATETLKLGAWDYVVKRTDLVYLDEVPSIVSRAGERLELRREQARLRAEMELLHTAIGSAGEAVVMTDGDGLVRFWNAAARAMFGWSAEEVMGKPLPIIVPERRGEFEEISARARRGQPLVGVETVLKGRRDVPVEVEATLTAVRNPDGAVRAYVAVIHGIGERKQLERDRADFVAMLTHDIKNPVTTIFGYAALLADAPLEGEFSDCVAAIERSAEMISALVSNFLMSASIERGTLELARDPLRVDELVSECSRQFHPAAQRRGIKLTCETGAKPVSVLGDHFHMERALSNLIGNALKFTPASGSVLVDLRTEGRTVSIRVQDTGPGIAPEALPHVFEKYRREGNARCVDGAGLGLHITRSLVEAHGGRVTVSSQLGEGSTFEIRLPLEGTG